MEKLIGLIFIFIGTAIFYLTADNNLFAGFLAGIFLGIGTFKLLFN